jgi:hypothetical protein
MNGIQSLTVIFLVGAALITAGCTLKTETAPPVLLKGMPTTSASLGQLVLTSSDLPPGFVRTDSRAKNSSDVSQLALDLGWEGGYVIRYVDSSGPAANPTEIVQTIAVYPEKNIPDIIVLAEKQTLADTYLTFSDIPVSGLGRYGRALKGTAVAQFIVKPETDNAILFGSQGSTAKAVFRQDTVIILFSKGNIFEALQMNGPGADYALLKDLADTAYARLD